MKRLVRSYPLQTVVQEKSGRHKVKLSNIDGPVWISRARWNYQKAHKNEELTSQHRVYHLDGDLTNDEPENLAAIKFTGKKYGLAHSRVVWMPKVAEPLKTFKLKKDLAVA